MRNLPRSERQTPGTHLPTIKLNALEDWIEVLSDKSRDLTYIADSVGRLGEEDAVTRFLGKPFYIRRLTQATDELGTLLFELDRLKRKIDAELATLGEAS